ncbi:MAG: phosphate ABC transporter permease PstA [Nitrospirota bacterium]|nr:phosphate ABC transporter permease PstA [Nitrospirota bacterium]MDH5700991.1 phosphate ABC transporter permease PstA [Nitrospirota bacterium]
MSRQSRHVQEYGTTAIIWMAATMVVIPFLWLIGDLLWNGWTHLSWSFVFSAPQNAGREGGIGPILMSTMLIVGVCMGVAVPMGLGTALFLSEYTRHDHVLGRLIRGSLDVLAGVPSIVFGLFGNALFCQALGLGFSILSGGLTLACMVLPILIRTAEESFRAISREQRLSAAALGLSQPTTIRTILLPAAMPGLLVGGTLGLGRAFAETAALIFTSGYVDRMPESLMDSGRSLAVHIYDLAMNVAGGNPNAFATALVLVGLLLIINLFSSWIATRWTSLNQLPA